MKFEKCTFNLFIGLIKQNWVIYTKQFQLYHIVCMYYILQNM